MTSKAFQDYYADEFSHCYGCGRLNEHGLQLKSYWEGEESVCTVVPEPYHTGGMKGIVYGGFIASVIDCHSVGTAAAAMFRSQGRTMGTHPPLRFVTASLHVDYLEPTPIGSPLTLRSRVGELAGRKVTVETELSAHDVICARGRVVAVMIPDRMSAEK